MARILSRKRGRWPRHWRWDRLRWTRWCRKTCGADAYGKTVWSW